MEGTQIITINKKENKHRKKGGRKRNRVAQQPIYNEAGDDSIEGDVTGQQKKVEGQPNSELQMRGIDEQTMGESVQGNLSVPYQFLAMRTPSIFSIFFPRFACKSITFILTIIHVILFAILLIYNYSQAQNDLTWNCSLFQLQNKYYPKLRYQYQIWRVFISAFFHSNIAHFVLNLFGLQVYGYFVEWHYGKIKYILLLVFTVIFSHFLAAITNQISISTTSSSLLFAIIALKIYFLYEYRQYKKLQNRRIFVYILMVLIVGINLIPIFVSNNVDYGGHLGGFICGVTIGGFYYLSKQQQISTRMKVLKWLSLISAFIGLLVVISLTFSADEASIQLLSDNIDDKCSNQ